MGGKGGGRGGGVGGAGGAWASDSGGVFGLTLHLLPCSEGGFKVNCSPYVICTVDYIFLTYSSFPAKHHFSTLDWGLTSGFRAWARLQQAYSLFGFMVWAVWEITGLSLKHAGGTKRFLDNLFQTLNDVLVTWNPCWM